MADDNKTDSPDLGGLVIPPAAGASAGAAGNAAPASASEAHIAGRKTRSDAGKPRGPRGAKSSGSIQPLSQTQFAQLYSPEVWGRILAGPATALAFTTGNKVWEVSPEEKNALGVSGSIAAQCFAVSDPKWLAVAIVAMTALEVYGVRTGIYLAELKRQREEKAKKQA